MGQLQGAINAAKSGLQVSQEAIAVITQNIANANTENYSRRTIEQASVTVGGIGQGVLIQRIARQIDEFLLESLQTANTALQETRTLEDFFDRVQFQLGEPDGENTLNFFIDRLFQSLDRLSTTPEQTSSQLDAVGKGRDLANKISGIAQGLEELRFSVDRDIKNAFSFLNQELSNIHTINLNILEAEQNSVSLERASLQEEQEASLRNVSGMLNITTFRKANDQINITAGNGIAILDTNLYEVRYKAATSVNDFINDVQMNQTTVVPIDPDTRLAIGTETELVSAGFKDSVIHKISKGKLKALLALRDIHLPRILDQLDDIAQKFIAEFNKIHNDGGGFPPLTSATGVQLQSRSEYNVWKGNVRIGVVNKDGTPVEVPDGLGGMTKVKPLDLQLDKLVSGGTSGGIAGRLNVETIMKEIDTHFGPPQGRAAIGNLYDVRLASKSADFTSNAFTFDFELDNNAGTDSFFEIQSIVAQDASPPPVVLTTAVLPQTTVKVQPGEKLRTDTNQSFTVDLSGAPVLPILIQAQVRVTYVDPETNLQKTDVQTISYSIDTPANPSTASNGVINNRYYASAVTSAPAKFIPPKGSLGVLSTSLQDVNGNAIPSSDATTQGYLRFDTLINDVHFIIEDDDSEELGLNVFPQKVATNRGFSHFFGMNNFFVENQTVHNTAINMHVREDLILKPHLFSRGKLTATQATFDPRNPDHSFQLGIGSNQAAVNLTNLRLQVISFNEAGTLPAADVNLSVRIADFIAFNSSTAANLKLELRNGEAIFEGFEAKHLNVSGVNIDEELANTIIFQNAYAASARIISVSGELLELLIRSF